MNSEPFLIPLPKLSGKSGYLSYMDEDAGLPINVRRVYWIYDSDEDAIRGNHAHVNSDRVLVCIKGKVTIEIKNPEGREYFFELDDPAAALFFPRMHWVKISFSKDSILMACSSCTFREDKLIRDYDEFMAFAG